MRTLSTGLVVIAVWIALAIGSFAAAKSYQFTGTVKSVEAESFTVEKSATEVWSFVTDPSTKGRPKIGDKVTVHYKMVATSIEAK